MDVKLYDPYPYLIRLQ